MQSGGKVAVVKGWLGNGKWSLPGGGLHKGESPAAGVLREAREETGLLIDPATVRPLVVAPYSAYGIHFSCHYFAAELPGQITLKPQLMEIAEVAWLDPRMLTARNANTDVLTALRFARGQSRALLQ